MPMLVVPLPALHCACKSHGCRQLLPTPLMDSSLPWLQTLLALCVQIGYAKTHFYVKRSKHAGVPKHETLPQSSPDVSKNRRYVNYYCFMPLMSTLLWHHRHLRQRHRSRLPPLAQTMTSKRSSHSSSVSLHLTLSEMLHPPSACAVYDEAQHKGAETAYRHLTLLLCKEHPSSAKNNSHSNQRAVPSWMEQQQQWQPVMALRPPHVLVQQLLDNVLGC